MKSLIQKDLYNIGHNMKAMALLLLVFAVILIPFSGPQTYVIACTVLCSIMITTTFSFDDQCKWNKYAMVMPISKKDLVGGKFIVLLIFCLVGVVSGFLIGLAGGVITHKLSFQADGILTLLLTSLAGLAIAEIMGSISIPLVFKFGAEKARMLLLVSVLIPMALFYGVFWLIRTLGGTTEDQAVLILLYSAPVVAILCNIAMYGISLRIFSNQEL
ncbi:ABC-2 transporter permease [Cuneatibacter sp. NSJ-177]|uniref:ABC-2 transporter permease n=1 Tax=Cuneatibacter sp. NSJ-177 TaxID=2931401 RepID=UPI001FD61EC9|nr:ABC-2 transporter permease [Cuneatibacter sp. NSJ-177]MCJ7835068.1 ABC-2 transporter permease [Cuneatibacter sp. NSJ-177]